MALRYTHMFSLIFGMLLIMPGARAADSKDQSLNSSVIETPQFPIENILDDLRQRFGFSFVFESRLLDGKTIVSVSNATRPERALRAELAEVDLVLHKIIANNYAITSAVPASSPIAPQHAVVTSQNSSAIFKDVIVVTAAASNKLGMIGTSNIFELDEEHLAYFNGASLSETIQQLPQTVASFTPENSSIYGPSAGLSFVDLRGLEATHTLVMLNGRRVTPMLGGNEEIIGVDLTRFSASHLERVEINATPAGARYGSNAVAGAVNFVTRSNINGLEMGIKSGITERGDGEEVSIHALAGRDFKNGEANISGGIDFTFSEGLVGADRPQTAVPYGFGRTGVDTFEFLPGFGGSVITDVGTISGAILPDGSLAKFEFDGLFIPTSNGGVVPFSGQLGQRYNTLAEFSTIPDINRFNGFVSLSAEITPQWKLIGEAHGGVSFSYTKLSPSIGSRFEGSSLKTGNAAVIPIDNPTIPAPLAQFVRDKFGNDIQSIVFDHRYREVGLRRDKVNRQYLDIIMGLEFDDGDKNVLSFEYSYGKTRTKWSQGNRINGDALQLALDVDACSLTPDCAPVDFFSPEGISVAAQEYITLAPIITKVGLQEHTLAAKGKTELDHIFSDPIIVNGELAIRRSGINTQLLSENLPSVIGGWIHNDISRSLITVDGALGFDFPLLRNSLIGDFDFTSHFRWTKPSEATLVTNSEFAIEWGMVPGIHFSSTYHFGERSPNITELLGGSFPYSTSIDDPCGVVDGVDDNIAVNCMSETRLGVSAGFEQGSGLTKIEYSGNPFLTPEKIHSKTFGIRVSPTDLIPSIPGAMQLSATWLSYEIEDYILYSDDTVRRCYASLALSSPFCGDNPLTGEPIITRDPLSEQLTKTNIFSVNDGDLSWRGLDAEFRYSLSPNELSFLDEIWFSGAYTYTDRVEYTDLSGDTSRYDGLVNYAKHQTTLSSGIELGRFGLALQARHRSQTTTRLDGPPEATIPATVYFDASIRMELSNDAFLQLGIENLTDQKAPIVAFSGTNTHANFYDLRGRRYSLSARVRF
ncbi:MAG: hypothetical protein DHS20C05_05750 [Hyphococcus sp.]|nr:MAG: hypothetical protein DHS20C05_05750 [Marinicaulis sp.]